MAVAREVCASTRGGRGVHCTDFQDTASPLEEPQVQTEGTLCVEPAVEALASASSRVSGHRTHGSPPSLADATVLGHPEAKAPRWRLNHGREILPLGI